MKYSKITISGKICTGKTTLFWDLQKKLEWPTFSTSQFFRDYARAEYLSLEKAQEQNTKLTKEVDSRMEKLLKQEGKLIAEGWMAGIMADELPHILRVLVVCKDEERIRRFSKRQNLDLKLAKQLILERETNWLKKIKKIYNRRDIFDPKNYNFVIDTANLRPIDVTRKVLDQLN